MAIYKCAPQSVVESSAAKDARLLSVSRQNLDEQAFFLFSGTPETSSILVNTELAGLSVYDWYSRQDEKTLGKKSRPYLYVPFEIEKSARPRTARSSSTTKKTKRSSIRWKRRLNK
ncbi:hypothetical protein [Allobaculum sp. Allo2]|uniref:hypothetical protein n=1 Tax=Allobaculum sp. Allo2 TaxID=2853432 RepID=UPI001F61BA5C|nr:hypothetical protein [Allobaculum sp. Allo2]UNT93883.1 hypothetical protein KWG61_04005 [Allobaculum sp. Allo2]